VRTGTLNNTANPMAAKPSQMPFSKKRLHSIA
jgi:hypothetical protein